MLNNNISINNFVASVSSFANIHHLFAKEGIYLVALSGGADSVALLLALLDIGVRVEAVHCNFHLRGEESDRDEQFCKDLCCKYNVELHLVHFDTREYAALHHVSIEMAARDLRYAYFERLRSDMGAEAICVAHHRDDSVETVLLNLVRGTGLRGLRGIQPKNGNIVRPLLCVSRDDIECFLDSIGQDYVTDSTNLHDDVKRNKLRLDVLPLLETLNPDVRQSIFRTSLRVGEALKMFDAAMTESVAKVFAENSLGGGAINLQTLLSQPSPEYVLFEILGRFGFTSRQVDDIYASIGACGIGKVFSSSEYDLLFDRDQLVVEKRKGEAERQRVIRIPEPGSYVFGDELRVKAVEEECGADYKPSRSNSCVCLDAAELAFPLTIRHIAKGDRFMPFGMHGQSKLVSDYLTDRKKNAFEKRAQLVLCDSKGRIAWLVNERIDDRFRISDKTQKAVRISVILKSDD